ncbi:MAG: hypothetical protein QNI84_10505 [Henriciella sp.]|nr:hypothetical protein [Henriciella sp.]
MLGTLGEVGLSIVIFGLVGLLLLISLPIFVDCRTGQRGDTGRFRFKLFAGLTPWIDIPTIPDRRTTRDNRNPRAQISNSRLKNILVVVPKAIRKIVSTIRWQRLSLHLDFGLTDPAATGELYGYLSPVLYGVGDQQRFAITAQPDFSNTRLDLTLAAQFRFTPIMLTPTAIWIAWYIFARRR